MIVDRVVAALESADPEITALEIAETLWLGRVMAAAPASGGSTVRQVTTPPPPTPRPAPIPEPGPRPEPARHSGTATDGHTGVNGGRRVGLFPSAGADGRSDGLHTRAPAVPALARTLALQRALRPLRRRLASPQPELDEEATAHASAVAGRPAPRYRSGRARWGDLALVVDDSPSMVVWRRTATELKALLERVGAFRTVRAFSIDSGLTGTERPVLRVGAPGHGARPAARCSPRELIAPTGRRIVLVLSDCVGPAWRGPHLAGWLAAWGQAMPLALLQPLPLRLWDRCAVETARVRLAGSRPGASNADLRTWQEPDPHTRRIPVPVLEIEPRWIAPWARLIAHTATTPMSSTAYFPPLHPGARLPDGAPAAREQDDDPVTTVLRFRTSASPETFELARYLSAAPLNLPVMRLVQSVMLPGSRPRHLAELFLSDLLVRRTPAAANQDAEAVLYDFRPGTRQLLFATLSPNTVLHILARASEFISRRFGAALDFPAILAGASVPAVLDEASRPFAEVASGVLETLGGRYRRLAGELTDALGQSPMMPAVVGMSTRTPTGVRTSRSTLSGGPVTNPPLPHGAEPGSAHPVWGGVPPRNPNFTGRVELLAGLQEQLASKVTAVLPHALHGLGGVGKTQLAVEYVYVYASEYDLVWWVNSEQPGLISESLKNLAPKLGVAVREGEDFGQTTVAINDALRAGVKFQRWLLVFDNAVNAEDLAPFLSNDTGHILITSRNRNWTTVAQTIEVDVFEREESIELLRRHLPDVSTADADRLADRLGDLPLALEQAAAWQLATAMSPERYLSLLDQQVGVLLSEQKPTDYPRAVAEAWGLAFQQLTQEAPAALQMLELCAFLGSEPISVQLLRKGGVVADRLPQPLGSVISEEIHLHRAIRDIARYGLAKTDPNKSSIQVHRLVQAVLRDRMTEQTREGYLDAVHALLVAFNPGYPDDRKNWEQHAELSPHIGPAQMVTGRSSPVRQTVLDQVRYRWIRGDYQDSRDLADMALSSWAAMFGEDDQYTLDAGRLKAIALRSLGQIEPARQLTESLYARASRALPAGHEVTISIGNSRGADLRLLGHWSQALALDEELLELHKRVYGLDDRNTGRAANNLAVDYRLLGQFEQARQLDSENAERLLNALGREHGDYLRTVSNLSRDLYGLGEYERALELQRDSLRVHREVLSDDHPEVLKATRIHVATLRKTGWPVEAHGLADELVRRAQRRLGENHPDTICSKMSLSNCLAAVGDLEPAKILGEDAEASFRDLLGAEHPFTLAAATNVATIQRRLIAHDRARALDERAVAGFRASLGDDHLYTYCAEMNLAVDLAVAGAYAEALALTTRALDGLTTIYHPLHPQVLVCRNNLALDLEDNGEPAEAHGLRRELEEQYRQVFGSDHPETQLMRRRLRGSIEIEPPNW